MNQINLSSPLPKRRFSRFFVSETSGIALELSPASVVPDAEALHKKGQQLGSFVPTEDPSKEIDLDDDFPLTNRKQSHSSPEIFTISSKVAAKVFGNRLAFLNMIEPQHEYPEETSPRFETRERSKTLC